MSGHGISDAVRENIRGWVQDMGEGPLRKLYLAYCQQRGKDPAASRPGVFENLLKDASSWKRFRRARSTSSEFSWERDYYCSCFSSREVGFRVWTNQRTAKCPEDYRIERYAFRIGNQIIGGGRCRIDSELIGSSQVRNLGPAPVQKSEIQSNEFVPLTEEELGKLATVFEYDTFGLERL